MSFLFAYLGTLSGTPGWPVHLIYASEAVFVVAALVCVFLAIILRGGGTHTKRDVIAIAGGVSASFGLIMPFELAPFFFGSPGEIMMATIALNLVYPIAAVLFVNFFWKFMKGRRRA
jgi:thiosulfate dehydrogenase (quinone) large subunit